MNRHLLVAMLLLLVSLSACTNSQPSPGNGTTNENTSATPLSIGQQLFETRCATCHGAGGTAGISNAANLHTSQLDSNTIIQVVTNGRNGMPSFKNSCTKEEIQKIAGYVYTLRK